MRLKFLNADIKELRRKDAHMNKSYPYEWVNSIKKFNYTELPTKEAFYSSLNANQRGKGDGHITDEEYLHEQNKWKIFKFKTFRDYHMHYLKKDVLLLTDVFENFNFSSINNIELDSCH